MTLARSLRSASRYSHLRIGTVGSPPSEVATDLEAEPTGAVSTCRSICRYGCHTPRRNTRRRAIHLVPVRQEPRHGVPRNSHRARNPVSRRQVASVNCYALRQSAKAPVQLGRGPARPFDVMTRCAVVSAQVITLISQATATRLWMQGRRSCRHTSPRERMRFRDICNGSPIRRWRLHLLLTSGPRNR